MVDLISEQDVGDHESDDIHEGIPSDRKKREYVRIYPGRKVQIKCHGMSIGSSLPLVNST